MLWFLIGLVLGTCIGVLVAALCAAAADHYNDEGPNGWGR